MNLWIKDKDFLFFENEEIIDYKNYFSWISWQQTVSFSTPENSKIVYNELLKIDENERIKLFNTALELYGENLNKELNLKTSYIFTQYNKTSWIYNTITEKIFDILKNKKIL